MVPRLISSLQHPSVKKLVKLRTDRTFREESGLILVVGETVVREVLRKQKAKTLISAMPLSLPADDVVLATPEVVQKIVGHKTDDLVAAVVAMPPQASLDTAQLIVALDGISDPGNVGTIFRTALAFGWDGALVTPGTADPYNDKALRSSRAASLLLPWREGALTEVGKRQVIVAHTKGAPLAEIEFARPLLLILGHETKGPSDAALRLGTPVTIPLRGPMESLNVAAAASIFLYEGSL